MLIRYKKIISFLLTMAVSASAVSAFASDKVTDDIINDDIVIKTEDTVLVKDVDYTLEYKDNVNVGTAKVIVHFIGNYSGEKEQTFNINRKTSGSGGGGGGSSRPSSNTVTVTITDKDGKPITTTKKEENDKVIITLPSNKELKDDEPYTVTVTDKGGKPVETEITLKDKKGNEATGKTDSDGKVTLPQTVEVTPSPTNEPEEVEHNAYISGYEDGIFIPDGQITRAETASMLYGVLETSNKEIDVTFSDLADGSWYIPAVKAMSDAGIINGYPDGTFRPENRITRAEFITMLMQNRNIEKCTSSSFNDVSLDLWSADYIYSAYEAGYIDGYEDSTFKPDSPITRAEAVKIINEVLGRTDFHNEINPFGDVLSTHWAYKHILEAAVTHNV